MKLQRVRAADVRPLRHEVLRAHEATHAVELPGDDDANSAHYAFVDHEARVIACASVMREGAPDAWRIRAVATAPTARGRGYGQQLVAACIEHAKKEGARVVWLQTAPAVVPWYVKQGFRPEGDVFVVERGTRQKLVRHL